MSAVRTGGVIARSAFRQRGRLVRLLLHPREAAEATRRARRVARIGSLDLVPFVDHVCGFGGTRNEAIREAAGEFERSAVITEMEARYREAFGADAQSAVHAGAGLMLREHAQAVYTICRVARPATVVETGVASGVSTTCILAALAENGHGHLHSFDLPDPIDAPPAELDRHADRAVLPAGRECGWLVPEALRGRWTLTLGPSLSTLPEALPTIGPIDLFLHDSLHTYDHMRAEFHLVWPQIRPGGALLSDDAHWNAAFEEAAARYGSAGRLLSEQRLGGMPKPGPGGRPEAPIGG